MLLLRFYWKKNMDNHFNLWTTTSIGQLLPLSLGNCLKMWFVEHCKFKSKAVFECVDRQPAPRQLPVLGQFSIVPWHLLLVVYHLLLVVYQPPLILPISISDIYDTLALLPVVVSLVLYQSVCYRLVIMIWPVYVTNTCCSQGLCRVCDIKKQNTCCCQPAVL